MRALTIAVLSTVLCGAAATSAFAQELVAPDTVRKTRISSTQVRITWKDPVDDEDGFEILRRTITNADFETRGVVGANVTEFIDDAPKVPVFIYQVRSVRDSEASDLSNQCFVNRPVPETPLSFRVRLIALTVVRVDWSDRSNGERAFDLQRAPLGTTKFKTVARIDANTETYDDYTLNPATSYTYRMRALGRPAICWGDSSYTPSRSVTTKGGVRILSVELRGRGKGKVTSIPAGISCSPQDDHCAAEFPIGTYVTLTPKPNLQSRFAGWAEYPLCDDEEGPCRVYMGEDKHLAATFRLNR